MLRCPLFVEPFLWGALPSWALRGDPAERGLFLCTERCSEGGVGVLEGVYQRQPGRPSRKR